MEVFRGSTIQSVYETLIRYILEHKNEVGGTYEVNNCCLVVKNPTLKDFYLPMRNVSEKYLNAELRWYWSGDNKCSTIGQFAKMWLALTDDGVTNNSAYGYILFKKYGFNQVEQIIELLKKDPASRRALLNISDLAINRITTKDMQCTIGIQFLIRNNALEETVYMRSNDVYFGLPYDYFFFVSIGQYIAKRLGLKLSSYTHHATSMHMYLRDVEKFNDKEIKLINVDVESIIGECYEK